MVWGVRRNIRTTARATRATAKATRQTAANTADLARHAADERAAREQEQRYRYQTDPEYRAFTDAERTYKADLLAYQRQVPRLRKLAALGLAVRFLALLAVAVATVVLIVTVWQAQWLIARQHEERVSYWQRDRLGAAFRRARALGRVTMPAVPQLPIVG